MGGEMRGGEDSKMTRATKKKEEEEWREVRE